MRYDNGRNGARGQVLENRALDALSLRLGKGGVDGRKVYQNSMIHNFIAVHHFVLRPVLWGRCGQWRLPARSEHAE